MNSRGSTRGKPTFESGRVHQVIQRPELVSVTCRASVASPQIPPRNTNFAAKGKWVHVAKIAFEKYFLRKVRHARNEPFYEKHIMMSVGAEKLKKTG